MSKTLAHTALRIAQGQLGITEVPKGSNWGDDVKKYLASVGINFPAAWCCAFVYWCFNMAAAGLKVKNPLFKTGGVLTLYNKSKRNVATKPEPGDVFIMDMGKGLGHTGFVLKVEGELIHTIEGNTNDEGSREGYEVCVRHRKINSIKAFLRFV